MRSTAAQYLHDYDLRPVTSDIYVTDAVDKGGKMIKALREWEQRRGIVHSFKSRFIEPKAKKVEEKPKAKAPVSRPIKVPRDRPTYTAAEKRQIKNENNRKYRNQNVQAHRARAQQWRESLTPEQKQEVYRKHREWREARKAARLANAGNGAQAA